MKQKLTKRQKGYKRPSRKKINPNSAKEKEIRKIMYQIKTKKLDYAYRGDKNDLRNMSLSDLRATTKVLKQTDKPILLNRFKSKALSLSRTKHITNNQTFYNNIIDIENETNKLIKEYQDKLIQIRETKSFKEPTLKQKSTNNKIFKKKAIRDQIDYLKLVKTKITQLKITTEELNKVDKNKRYSDDVLKKRITTYSETIKNMTQVVDIKKTSVEKQYRFEKDGIIGRISRVYAPEQTKLYIRKEEYERHLHSIRKHVPDYELSFEEFNQMRDEGSVLAGTERPLYIKIVTEDIENKIKKVAEKYGWDSDEVKNLKIKLGQELAEHD